MPEKYICPPHLLAEDETERIQVLRECQILDTARDDTDFDRYTSLACRIFKAPNSQVCLVDKHRAWPKSHFGVGTPVEIPRHHAICSNVVLSTAENVVVINDCSVDDRVKHYPAVKAGLRFYAGGVIVVNNRKIGSFCILDFVPREFHLTDRLNLMEMAAAVSQLISSRRELYLQQEFMKMLLHNLRTPLTSLNFSVSILALEKQNGAENVNLVVEEINNAVKSLNSTVEKSLNGHPNYTSETVITTLNSVSDEHVESIECAELESRTIPSSKNNSMNNSSNNLAALLNGPHENESNDAATAVSTTTVQLNLSTVTTKLPKISPRDIGHRVAPLPLKNSTFDRKIRVLLIEDSVMIQKVMRKWLESYGCEVHSALHGLQGLNKMKTEQFDIVITDFLMPVMDGLECLQQYSEHLTNNATQQHNQNSNMLIIGMSATADNNEVQKAFQYGMHCFSAKPVDLKLLEKCIELKKSNIDLPTCIEAMQNSQFADSSPRPDVKNGEKDVSGSSIENKTDDLTDRVHSDVRARPSPRKSSFSFIEKWLFRGKIAPVVENHSTDTD